MWLCFFCFESYVSHRDLLGLTHSFPTRRSADLCDLANMIDAVLMADRMHAVAQRHVLNVEFGYGWVERHHAASFCNRRAAIFSAVASAAEVIMSRLPA